MTTDKKQERMKYEAYPFSYPMNLPMIEISTSRHISDFEVERRHICIRAHTMKEAKDIYDKVKND